MDTQRNTILNQKGQSAVEYILLMFVLVSLGLSIFNSDMFKNFFGPGSQAFESLRKRMEYNYRYALDGRDDQLGTDYQGGHPSYVVPSESQTRFFSPISKYP